MRRRLELRGEVGGVTVYDDFAHHPTAMRTTLDGLRRKVGAARILAVFEPRSNTMKLGAMKAQLPWALEEADLAFCYCRRPRLGRRARRSRRSARARDRRRDDRRARRRASSPRRARATTCSCMSNGGFGGIHDKLLDALAPPGDGAAPPR